MNTMEKMKAVDGTKVQGPVSGPIDFDLIKVMRKYDVPIAYSYGKKYVKTGDIEITISWDIHR